MDSFLGTALQMGIGGLCVGGLVYTVQFVINKVEAIQKRYLEALEAASIRHEKAMLERENRLRDVEAHVRETLTSALTQNTIALTDAAKILGKVTRILDK